MLSFHFVFQQKTEISTARFHDVSARASALSKLWTNYIQLFSSFSDCWTRPSTMRRISDSWSSTSRCNVQGIEYTWSNRCYSYYKTYNFLSFNSRMTSASNPINPMCENLVQRACATCALLMFNMNILAQVARGEWFRDGWAPDIYRAIQATVPFLVRTAMAPFRHFKDVLFGRDVLLG